MDAWWITSFENCECHSMSDKCPRLPEKAYIVLMDHCVWFEHMILVTTCIHAHLMTLSVPCPSHARPPTNHAPAWHCTPEGLLHIFFKESIFMLLCMYLKQWVWVESMIWHCVAAHHQSTQTSTKNRDIYLCMYLHTRVLSSFTQSV